MGLGLRARFSALCLGVVLALAPAGAWGQDALRGVALVIGQSDYATIADLPNAERDADAIESLFRDLGFSSSAVADRDARRLSRDLDTFFEDAEGADVAVVYYAGHAVEVGGENYLVPTDAEISSPDKLAESLIPLSRYVATLQSKAKVTIVLLDACRDNPFPVGTTIRRPGDAAPVAVSSTGLQSRGVVAVARGAQSADLGIVVGFAAEPGKAALDGEPGSNSPYAAALLRHIGAMAGEEFGTVMRMVAQEVYLKTRGRQRPWVNESLHRLLYFGRPVQDPQGDEGDILRERRQLLLTIADLPDLQRLQVENAATEAGVPMDALYGMLKMLGSEVPKDAEVLQTTLDAATERLKSIMAERRSIMSSDPEIQRLTSLADSAEAEGLLVSALELRERATARFREIEPTLRKAEAEIDRRYVEGSAVYGRSGETRMVASDYLGAASDFRQAWRLVEGRDRRLEVLFGLAELNALSSHGTYFGDLSILRDAVKRGEKVIASASILGDRGVLAQVRNDIAIMFVSLSTQEATAVSGTIDLLASAEAGFRASAEAAREVGNRNLWRTAIMNLAHVQTTLGTLADDPATVRSAVTALESLLTDETEPGFRADILHNIGYAHNLLGSAGNDPHEWEQAVDRFEQSIAVRSKDRDPIRWGDTQSMIGMSLRRLAYERKDARLFRDALDAFDRTLEVTARETMALRWARIHHLKAHTLSMQSVVTGERDLLFEAHREALAANEQFLELDAPFWQGANRELLDMIESDLKAR